MNRPMRSMDNNFEPCSPAVNCMLSLMHFRLPRICSEARRCVERCMSAKPLQGIIGRSTASLARRVARRDADGLRSYSITSPAWCRNAGISARHSSAAALPTATVPSHSGIAADFADPNARSAYLHLPFCKKKCSYCDFPVVAVGTTLQRPVVQDRMQDYVDLLLAEIDAVTHVKNSDKPLETVFFGGGTPSLIPPPLLEQILGALREKFGIDEYAEVSMEADPGTFDAERLQQYMDLGLTRFSVGVQAFQEEHLVACGRSHGLADVEAALADIAAAAPPSWSLDLISGLPDLTREQWRHSLQRAIDAKPPHISVYDLQVEAGTPFARWHEEGKLSFPDDEEGAVMYADASQMLREAGYLHYELSNYAKQDHACRHNLTYWHSHPFYGFGLGAASYLGGRRLSRPRGMAQYRDWVHRGCLTDGCTGAPAAASPAERLLDTVMLRLRLGSGLDLARLEVEYGEPATAATRRALRRHEASGAVVFEWPGCGEERARLTDPKGFLLSNDVISDVFAELSP